MLNGIILLMNDMIRSINGINAIQIAMVGFPYLKIEKLPNFLFMPFDRYEIHIQYFVDFP